MVQPRPQHPDEVIVWEMDERTLPLGVTDGRGEQRASMHHCTLHPASPLLLSYTSTFHLVSLVTLHLDLIRLHIHFLFSSHALLTFSSHKPYSIPFTSHHPHSLPSPHTSPTPLFLPSHQPYSSLPPLMHTVPPTLGVLCTVPIPPLDGEVSWSSNEVGAALQYYCREGFHLVGTASQECLPIGEWSSYAPLCMKGESVGGAVCVFV